MPFFRYQDGSAHASGGRRRLPEPAGGGGGRPRQAPGQAGESRREEEDQLGEEGSGRSSWLLVVTLDDK